MARIRLSNLHSKECVNSMQTETARLADIDVLVQNYMTENPLATPGNLMDYFTTKSADDRICYKITYDSAKHYCTQFRKDKGVPNFSEELNVKSFVLTPLLRFNNSFYKEKEVVLRWGDFCFESAVEMLNEAKFILIDGTFDNAPSKFLQIVTIMTFDEHTGHFIPLVYMLLNTKKEENYWFAFWDLSHLLPPDQITWQSITTDFEKALINAVARTWANVPIQGCLFHFKEALLRKAQKKSLTNNDQLPKVLKTLEEIAGFSFEENGSEKLQGFSRKCTYARKFRAND